MFYATITTNNTKLLYKFKNYMPKGITKWLRKTINTTHFVQKFDFLKPT